MSGVIYVSEISISRILSPSLLGAGMVGNHLSCSGITAGIMPPYNRHVVKLETIVRLHRIGVFLSLWLPTATVGSYPTLFTFASSALKTFSVFVATIGGIVSVTLSRPAVVLSRNIIMRRTKLKSILTVCYIKNFLG